MFAQGGPEWNIEGQKALCAEIAEKIGFDFNKYVPFFESSLYFYLSYVNFLIFIIDHSL